jgi:hypothetical protein
VHESREQEQEREREIPQCGSSHHLCIHPGERAKATRFSHASIFHQRSNSQNANPFVELTDEFHIPLLFKAILLANEIGCSVMQKKHARIGPLHYAILILGN